MKKIKGEVLSGSLSVCRDHQVVNLRVKVPSILDMDQKEIAEWKNFLSSANLRNGDRKIEVAIDVAKSRSPLWIRPVSKEDAKPTAGGKPEKKKDDGPKTE